MPRVSEIPQQRHSHRVPLRLKSTASSEANSLHRTAGIERSSKLEDRRSSRIVLEEKKRGLRMADLEKKLDQTMEELKKLKEQLASAEAVKTVVQNKLEKVEKAAVFPLSTKSVPNPEDVDVADEKNKLLPVEKDSDSCITSDLDEIAASCSEENASKLETKVMIEKTSRSEEKCEDEGESKLLLVAESAERLEMSKVRAKLAEQEKKLETVLVEKESLKKEAGEAKAALSIAGKKTEEMEIKLAETEVELKQSKSLVVQLTQKLEAEEVGKASMEAEMKLLRIQTDQWRKASEAAASILSTGDESFRSTPKTLESCNFSANGVLWSPLVTAAEVDEGQEGQKKRGSGGGIRVFGELWKKKGQQK